MNKMLNPLWWRERLEEPLPGEKAQQMMAPAFRGTVYTVEPAVPAAVLVLFYPSGQETCLAFIKRNAYDGPHSAQVSFPGGSRELQDRSLEETALRETREELGIREKIEILGALTPLHIPVSNYLVHPFVGLMGQAPVFRPDPAEVQYVIEATLTGLQDPLQRGSAREIRQGVSMEVPYYMVGKEKIWGATAMMLSEVLQLAAS
jgi:8-oxo-dGTP pyrophosphatase MutT (NUDIX family)